MRDFKFRRKSGASEMKNLFILVLLFISLLACSSPEQRESIANDHGKIIFRTRADVLLFPSSNEYFIVKEGLVVTIKTGFLGSSLGKLDSLPPCECPPSPELLK